VYHNVLYVTHASGNDEFYGEGKIANTGMREGGKKAKGDGERKRTTRINVGILDGRRT